MSLSENLLKYFCEMLTWTKGGGHSTGVNMPRGSGTIMEVIKKILSFFTKDETLKIGA